ncbi:MAG TPA: hypothetical protein VE974_27060 [Thermoanaerobaculia bacterium]|nr:hypothetical protein [Thermoanaerobaculia bacterium]
MKVPANIIVYDRFGQLLLLAEVRSVPETTPEWAKEIRQDVIRLMEGFLPRYFLVVSRDRSYLWLSASDSEALPDLILPTEELLSNYLRNVDSSASAISGNALELVVGIWLRDITRGDARARSVLPQNVDLATAVEHGRMEFAAAA